MAVVSWAGLIEAFVRRQYVTEEGSVRDNVESLFAADLAYHAGDATLTREDLVAMGAAVRATRRPGRKVTLSGWEEEGQTVRWHLSAFLPAMGADGQDVVQESEVTAVFGTDGLVHEVWSRDADPR